jgi:hypothetical protein
MLAVSYINVSSELDVLFTDNQFTGYVGFEVSTAAVMKSIFF